MELHERFVAGDPEAFEALFREYQQDVYNWIFRVVRNRADAEDLTIEVFLRIHRARARFDPTRKFAPWARRIATNLALSRLRTVDRHLPLLTEPQRAAPADPVERYELRKEISEAFGALSPKLRLVALLALVEELPYAEIAEGVGVSREAVKSRVFRALRQLRRKLGSKGIVP